jgi:hypothetical protein
MMAAGQIKAVARRTENPFAGLGPQILISALPVLGAG